MTPLPSVTFCTVTVDGTNRPIALSTAAALDSRTESGSPKPPSVIVSTRTATRPALAYGVPVMTNSVVPKKTRALATNRTPLVVVRTTGSRTVTPLTVCGNDEAAACVSSASVTASVKVNGGATVAVPVAEDRGVAERVGDALPLVVGVGAGKTTLAGTQSRSARTAARITTARSASRASAATV